MEAERCAVEITSGREEFARRWLMPSHSGTKIIPTGAEAPILSIMARAAGHYVVEAQFRG